MLTLLTLVVLTQAEPLPPPPPPPPPEPGAEQPLTPPPLPPPSPVTVTPDVPPGPTPRPPAISNPRYEEPVSTIVHFSPLSLFGLYASVEFEHLTTPGWSVFGGAGLGVFGQLGLDAGMRFWGGADNAFDGVFGDARLSCFAVPGSGWVLAGVGGTVGYGWRSRRTVAMSVGVGLTLWAEMPTGVSATFGSSPSQRSTLIFLPGIQTTDPNVSPVAVQPTLRFTLGPAF